MKKISVYFVILFILGLNISHISAQNKSLYDFTVKDINGKDYNFSQLRGKKVLIVNVASKCGFTPQYAQLEELYQKYKNKDFIIIAFPSNDFKEQEPGTNTEIKNFCQRNYGVTFPIMSKISVKGNEQASIYKWLTQKSENGQLDAPVKWNFQKFMIDKSGQLVDFAPSQENPLSDKIVNWININ